MFIEGGIVGVQWFNCVFHFLTNSQHVQQQAVRSKCLLYGKNYCVRLCSLVNDGFAHKGGMLLPLWFFLLQVNKYDVK